MSTGKNLLTVDVGLEPRTVTCRSTFIYVMMANVVKRKLRNQSDTLQVILYAARQLADKWLRSLSVAAAQWYSYGEAVVPTTLPEVDQRIRPRRLVKRHSELTTSACVASVLLIVHSAPGPTRSVESAVHFQPARSSVRPSVRPSVAELPLRLVSEQRHTGLLLTS